MEIKTAAVVLKTADYKENDKLLTLFSADRGKFTACIKGVRKPTARLRPAAQPFTLAEFVLSERRGFYTVTQAEVLDSFFAVRADLDKFYCASAMAQFLCMLIEEGQDEPELFAEFMDALKRFSYQKTDPKLYLVRFLLFAAKDQGVGADFSACAVCGKDADEMAFSFADGCVRCAACRKAGDVPLKNDVYLLLKTVEEADADDLVGKKGDPAAERGALRLLADYFMQHEDLSLSSLEQYLAFFSPKKTAPQ